jgi:hypothetical protein
VLIYFGRHEEKYGSSDDERSLMKNDPKKISPLTGIIDQDQEKQLSIQKEELQSINLGKLDVLVSQTRCSGFGRTEASLVEEDGCSISSSEDDDDSEDSDDDSDDDDLNRVLMFEFEKLVGMHRKLQDKHSNLLCSHEKLIDSYALLETAHEVVMTTVKSFQPHTCIYAHKSIDVSCANSCCSQTKPSCDEHAIVET